MITQNHLKEIVYYDPETGVFTWKPRPIRDGRMRRHDLQWNTRYAGRRADRVAPSGYRRISLGNKKMQAHRAAWLYVNGYLPPEIDHVNRVRGDNRITNLRPASHAENIVNQSPQARRNGALKGAYRHRKRWHAKITLDWKVIFLGSFDTAEEAHAVYMKAAKEAWGEFAA